MTQFLIYSAGWNCSDFIEKHVESVKQQTYKNYRHILVDDCSTDDTYKKLLSLQDDKMEIFKSEKNQKWLHNSILYLTPNIKDDEEVIVIVDMDDWIANDYALEHLNEVYEEYKCWVTYSQLQRSIVNKPDNTAPYSNKVVENRDYRKAGWRFMSMKSFKAFLWRNIDPNDFKGKDRKYSIYAYDIAMAMPILEMTPPDKLVYIPFVYYIYNIKNPNSVINKDFIHMQKRMGAEHFFRRKPKYKLYRR